MVARDPATDVALEGDWKGVCRLAGVAALLQCVCSLATLASVLLLGGEPASVEDYFTALNQDRLVGLLRLDFPSVVNMALYYVLLLGLYAALRRTSEGYVTLATALGYVGIMLWLSAHSALSMVQLADRYAAAAPERRAALLAAGEAVIASDMWHATPAHLAGLLAQCAVLFLCIVMLWSDVFGRIVAWVGIVTHGLDLAHVVIGAAAPGFSVALMMVAGPLYLVWFVLVGRRLLQLGR